MSVLTCCGGPKIPRVRSTECFLHSNSPDAGPWPLGFEIAVSEFDRKKQGVATRRMR